MLTLKVPAEVVLQEITAAVGFNNLVEDMPYSLIDLSMLFCDQGMGYYLTIRCIYEYFDVFCVCGASLEVLQPSQALKIQILHHRKPWTLALWSHHKYRVYYTPRTVVARRIDLCSQIWRFRKVVRAWSSFVHQKRSCWIQRELAYHKVVSDTGTCDRWVISRWAKPILNRLRMRSCAGYKVD